MTSEAPLLDQVQASPTDEKLWTELFRRLHPRVYVLAYRLSSGDASTAEDLTQEAFLRFIRYKAFSRLTSEEAAVGYLRAILRNVVRDYYRKADQIPTVSLDDPSTATETHHLEAAIASTLSAEDFSILDGLDAEDQRLLRLVIEGWTMSEIAEKMDLRYSACAVRLHRIKKKLREL